MATAAALLRRHPLSAKYPDITGPAWDEFVDFLKRHGPGKRKIVLLDGMVLDGWQLYRGCLEANIEPPTEVYDEPLEPEKFVDRQNDHRRHESEEVQRARRIDRRQRIVQQRSNGASYRTIAADNGVSVTQVRNVLKQEEERRSHESNGTSAGVQGCTPEANGHQEKVRGRDGKTYPKTKDKKKKKKKAGSEKKVLKDDFGNVLPDRCRDAFADPWIQQTYDALCLIAEQFRKPRMADGMEKRRRSLPMIDAASFIHGIGMIDNTLDLLITHLKDNRPAAVCKQCAGEGCATCSMSGLVSRKVYQGKS